MPQEISTPTTLGTILPIIFIQNPITDPLPAWVSGIIETGFVKAG